MGNLNEVKGMVVYMKEYFERLYKNDENSFYNELTSNIKKNKKMFIVTVNPETIMLSEKDKIVKELLLDEEVTLVPDGISIVKAAKKFKIKIKERITGIDITEKLFSIANKEKLKLYIYGSKQEVLHLMKEKIKKDYKNILLVGLKNGYTNNPDQVFEDIKKKNPDIIIVALGIPNQEKLIYKHYKDFKKGIFIGVGGSIDVLSGSKRRAPKTFIKLNLEWFYRVTKEPKRIKRFYGSNIKFMWRVYLRKK